MASPGLKLCSSELMAHGAARDLSLNIRLLSTASCRDGRRGHLEKQMGNKVSTDAESGVRVCACVRTHYEECRNKSNGQFCF